MATDLQEMAYIEAYVAMMCPPTIIIGCALIIWTIGVAGIAGIAVRRFLSSTTVELTNR